MDCRCGKKAVYDGLGQKICKDHFLSYFEDKVFWTIRKYKLIEQGDTICVAASGGKDSLTVLYLTMKFCREHNVPFFALADMPVELYSAEDCPLCKSGVPIYITIGHGKKFLESKQ